jgi:hypothetical protein
MLCRPRETGDPGEDRVVSGVGAVAELVRQLAVDARAARLEVGGEAKVK